MFWRGIAGASIAALALVWTSQSAAPVKPAADDPHQRVPWVAGEHLEYQVKLAGLKSGTGIMDVVGIETMRGRPAWHLNFNIKGSTPLGLYHVDDTYDSWMDVATMNSLRFEQHLYEGGKHTTRLFDIFPDRGIFHQEGRDERKSVSDPLDEASLFFFIRTIPLEVGKEYVFDRYFNPDGNPVVIKVVRRDTIDVPAGRFPAIVLQPGFRTQGLFSEDGRAEIFLSDDERRVLLKMDTHFAKVISLNLQLRKATFAAPEKKP